MRNRDPASLSGGWIRRASDRLKRLSLTVGERWNKLRNPTALPCPTDGNPEAFRPSLLQTRALPILLCVVLTLVFLIRFSLAPLARSPWEYPAAALCVVAAILLPTVVFLRLHPLPIRDRLRVRAPHAGTIPFCVFASVTAVSGCFLAGLATGEIGTSAGSYTLYHAAAARTASGWQAVGAIVVCAILPALCEEFLLRGVLISVWEPAGVPVAVLLTTVSGAALTTSFRALPGAILLGLICTAALYATRSLLPPVILHAVYGVFRVFFAPGLAGFYRQAGSGDLFLLLAVGIFLLFAAFAAGSARKLYHRYARQGLASRYAPYLPLRRLPHRLLSVLRSPPLAVFAALWLAASIYTAILGD